MENRMHVFDFLRSIAIFIILFHHLPWYSFNFYNLEHFGIDTDLSLLNELNRYFGLGLFIFVSGYLGNAKDRKFADRSDIGRFFLKKILRIFPLYYLALVFFCYLYQIEDPLSIMLHVFGLHLVLAPGIVSPSPTLWFIGLIMLYYGVFVFAKAENVSRPVKAAGLALFPFLVAALHNLFQIMDERIVLYYGIYLSGIYAARNNIFEKITWIQLLIVSGLLVAFLAFRGQSQFAVNPFHSATAFFTVNAVMLVFISAIYKIAGVFTAVTRLRNWIEIISAASFCMFLFHRPIWAFLETVLKEFLAVDHKGLVGFFLVFFGIPLIIAVSYNLQILYDRVAGRLSPRIDKSSPVHP